MAGYVEEANKDIEACKEYFKALNRVPHMWTVP